MSALAKSKSGWVVIVRGWDFVTASALLSYPEALAIQRRLRKSGEKVRLERRMAT